MPFRFSLESVLSVRKNVERREQFVLDKINQEIANTRQRIAQTVTDRELLRQARDAQLTAGISGFQLQCAHERELEYDNLQRELSARLHRLECQRADQLSVLQRAQRDHQTISEMRDRQLRAYGTEMARREQKAIDDLFLSRRNR